VEVRRTLDCSLVSVEDAEEVRQVVAVATYLEDGVKERSSRHAVHGHKLVVVFPTFGAAPLLQLDDDVGVLPCAWVYASEDCVDPLARQRQPVLDDHLYRTEPGIDQIVGQDRETAIP
jgi:hypothetical protein